MAKYACFIREALGKTKGRECVPSLEEILVLMRRQEMICTVHCPGAPACSVAISSHTTAEEVRGRVRAGQGARDASARGAGWAACRGRRGAPVGLSQLERGQGPPAFACHDMSVSLCSPECRGRGRAVTVGCLCLAQVARELVSRLGLSQSPNLFALYEQSRRREQPVGNATLLADVLTRFEK